MRLAVPDYRLRRIDYYVHSVGKIALIGFNDEHGSGMKLRSSGCEKPVRFVLAGLVDRHEGVMFGYNLSVLRINHDLAVFTHAVHVEGIRSHSFGHIYCVITLSIQCKSHMRQGRDGNEYKCAQRVGPVCGLSRCLWR